MKVPLLAALATVGCTPTTYSVTHQHWPDGNMNEVCEYTDDGTSCSGDINGRPISFETGSVAEDIDPIASEEVVSGALARFAPAPRPSEADVAHAIATPGVRGKLAACRARYAPETDHVQATLTLEPSGTIAKIALADADGGNDSVGACVARVLHEVQLHAFAGDPVVVAQTVGL